MRKRKIIVLFVVDALRYDYSDIIYYYIKKYLNNIKIVKIPCYAAGYSTYTSYPAILTSLPSNTDGKWLYVDSYITISDILNDLGWYTVGFAFSQPFLSPSLGYKRKFHEYYWEFPGSGYIKTKNSDSYVSAIFYILKDKIINYILKSSFKSKYYFTLLVIFHYIKLFFKIIHNIVVVIFLSLTNNSNSRQFLSFYDYYSFVIKKVKNIVYTTNKNLFIFIHSLDLHMPYDIDTVVRSSKKVTQNLIINYFIFDLYPILPKFLKNNLGKIKNAIHNMYRYNVVKFAMKFIIFMRVLHNICSNNCELLVILTSDHGESLGEHNILGHDGDIRSGFIFVPYYYQELVKVPFIMLYKGYNLLLSTPKYTGNLICTHYDLFPTLYLFASKDKTNKQKQHSILKKMYVLGFPIINYLNFRSQEKNKLMERTYHIIEGPGYVIRDFTTLSFYGKSYSIICDNKFKFIITYDTISNNVIKIMYDLNNDPSEQRNIYYHIDTLIKRRCLLFLIDYLHIKAKLKYINRINILKYKLIKDIFNKYQS